MHVGGVFTTTANLNGGSTTIAADLRLTIRSSIEGGLTKKTRQAIGDFVKGAAKEAMIVEVGWQRRIIELDDEATHIHVEVRLTTTGPGDADALETGKLALLQLVDLALGTHLRGR
ncbi:MAG: hypothetical protein WC030_01385 [Candidatus Paceibacterota bacterium]